MNMSWHTTGGCWCALIREHLTFYKLFTLILEFLRLSSCIWLYHSNLREFVKVETLQRLWRHRHARARVASTVPAVCTALSVVCVPMDTDTYTHAHACLPAPRPSLASFSGTFKCSCAWPHAKQQLKMAFAYVPPPPDDDFLDPLLFSSQQQNSRLEK